MKKLLLVTLLGLSTLPLTGCAPLVVAGAGTGAVMYEDRRSSGAFVADQEIELRVASEIREKYGKNTHVNVTSFNRRVMLTGEVPDAATRDQVAALARGVKDVREVQNELIVGETSGFLARSKDGYITSKVKTRFLDDKRFSTNHVKVVTEARTVYLMGVVKREEGDAAAEIAARTSDVVKVVKVFEYID
ncbi:MAG: hypothetical protein FD187_841 [bacterium]|nr:MAG: hypothetical protein FD142_582 [bacterium]KAF0149884.1 MAG: hypothetical protein FD187_841 [bacterium]KAF0166346.1 MAG: hypothetical protein FD158_2630 [bacterium]TXT16164.1 MAG: hypothetical protein FD132_2966 [bacterium]